MSARRQALFFCEACGGDSPPIVLVEVSASARILQPACPSCDAWMALAAMGTADEILVGCPLPPLEDVRRISDVRGDAALRRGTRT